MILPSHSVPDCTCNKNYGCILHCGWCFKDLNGFHSGGCPPLCKSCYAKIEDKK